jgi:hypothetical protein
MVMVNNNYVVFMRKDGTGLLKDNNGHRYLVTKSNLKGLILNIEIPISGLVEGKEKKGLLKGKVYYNGRPINCFKLYLEDQDPVDIYGYTLETIISEGIGHIDLVMLNGKSDCMLM